MHCLNLKAVAFGRRLLLELKTFAMASANQMETPPPDFELLQATLPIGHVDFASHFPFPAIQQQD